MDMQFLFLTRIDLSTRTKGVMRTKNQTNSLGDAFTMVRSAWDHRPGNRIPASVKDTIIALWPHELKPLIVRKEKYPSSYTFVINLPPGICYADFKSKEQYFTDSTKGAVQIRKSGAAVIMQIMTDELKTSYAYQWDYAKYDKMYLPIPFGYSASGFIVRDLSKAPNLLIAGHPGAGKSNFLHVLAVSLLISKKLYLIVIDLKKLEFSYLKKHALVISELEAAQNLLKRVNFEMDKRLSELERSGVVKIQDYPGDMPFIVLIVDELAELQDEQCQTALNRIVRLGRAAGICVACATQRPSSTMFAKFGDSKAMFAANLCFHVRDTVNSRMVLDNDSAAYIPNVPGRAIYQWESEMEVQTMNLPVSLAKLLINPIEGVRWHDNEPCKRLPPR